MSLRPLTRVPYIFRVILGRLLKTLWKKEKLLVTSNFCFFHNVFYLVKSRSMSSGEFGSGAGKGGGSGGSIRDAGGSFGKMEAAHEEEYFRKLRAEQLKQLKEHKKIEEKFHANQIKVHEDAIKAHKEAIEKMKDGSDSD